MTDLRVKLEPASVRYEDVDEVIGLAAKMAQADAERLSADELRSVASQLDIPAAYVDRAIAALEARAAAAERARARRRRLVKRASLGLAATALLLGVVAVAGQNGLQTSLAVAEQKRAQVRNVLDRQATVASRLRDAPPGPDRDAELSGAENRVAVERRRYDEAAGAYNASAGGFPGALWARVFGLPRRLPLSNELRDRW